MRKPKEEYQRVVRLWRSWNIRAAADLGEQTVLSGSVSRNKESNSRSLQMAHRRMTPDKLKAIPRDSFINNEK